MSKPSSILHSSALVSALSAVGSLVSFFNQLIIARSFGVSSDLEAYQIGISAPTAVSGVIVAALIYALVPLLVNKRMEEDQSPGFQRSIVLAMTGVAVVTVLVGRLASGFITNAMAAGLSSQGKQLVESVSTIAWLSAGLAIVLSALACVHNASKSFVAPVVANVYPFLGMIASCLLFAHSWGVLSIAYGLLAGTALGCIDLVVRARSELGGGKSHKHYSTDIGNFMVRLPVVLVSMLIFCMFQFIDAYWAPKIGPSSLPALGYCQRILIALGGLVTAGPAAVLGPRLAEAATQGRNEDYLRDVIRSIRLVVVFAGLAGCIVALLATPLIRVMFQRGKFDASATGLVASLLPAMMTGMVAMLCVVMMFRAFYAKGELWMTSAVSLICVGGYFALSGLMMKWFGTQGIAFAYAAVWWFVLGISLAATFRGNVHRLINREQAFFGLKIVLNFALCALAVVGLMRAMHGQEDKGLGSSVALLMLSSTAAVGVFYVVSRWLLPVSDVNLVFSVLEGVVRRRLPAREVGPA